MRNTALQTFPKKNKQKNIGQSANKSSFNIYVQRFLSTKDASAFYKTFFELSVP